MARVLQQSRHGPSRGPDSLVTRLLLIGMALWLLGIVLLLTGCEPTSMPTSTCVVRTVLTCTTPEIPPVFAWSSIRSRLPTTQCRVQLTTGEYVHLPIGVQPGDLTACCTNLNYPHLQGDRCTGP